jgi:hypothetical protein
VKLRLVAGLAACCVLLSGVAATAGPVTTTASPPVRDVVIAVLDNGINPYHQDYADPARTAPPASYLTGYPASATPLYLDLQSNDYATARGHDEALWRGLKMSTLYWVPGTKIAGLIALPETVVQGATEINASTNPNATNDPFIDNNGHGNSVASVAVGNKHGSCPRCLIVVINTQDFAAGLAWAASQPWIDIVSNSWSSLGQSPYGSSATSAASGPGYDTASRKAVAAGKLVLFAAGNGATGTGPYIRATPDRGSTLASPTTGPAWVLTVGAASPGNGQPTPWHNVPVDVIGYGQDWPAATAASIDRADSFFGTSCATPVVAGVIGTALWNLRHSMATDKGSGGLVRIMSAALRPATGPFADGILDQRELRTLAEQAAQFVPFDVNGFLRDPSVTPNTDLAAAYAGHGLLNAARAVRISQLALGKVAAPTTSTNDQAFFDRVAGLRTSFWGAQP